MSTDKIIGALESKRSEDKSNLAKTLLDADRRGFWPISSGDRAALRELMALIRSRLAMPARLLLTLERCARQYQQHLVALAAGRSST